MLFIFSELSFPRLTAVCLEDVPRSLQFCLWQTSEDLVVQSLDKILWLAGTTFFAGVLHFTQPRQTSMEGTRGERFHCQLCLLQQNSASSDLLDDESPVHHQTCASTASPEAKTEISIHDNEVLVFSSKIGNDFHTQVSTRSSFDQKFVTGMCSCVLLAQQRLGRL